MAIILKPLKLDVCESDLCDATEPISKRTCQRDRGHKSIHISIDTNGMISWGTFEKEADYMPCLLCNIPHEKIYRHTDEYILMECDLHHTPMIGLVGHRPQTKDSDLLNTLRSVLTDKGVRLYGRDRFTINEDQKHQGHLSYHIEPLEGVKRKE